MRLEIDDEFGRILRRARPYLCPRYADHDLTGFFVLREDHVAMLGLARAQCRAARAARTALARTRRANAVVAQDFENRPVRRNIERASRALEPHLEWTVLRPQRLVHAEALEVNASLRTAPGHIAHAVHQRTRPAAVDMRTARRFFEQRPEIERVATIAMVVMDRHSRSPFFASQLVEERRIRRLAREIHELEARSVGAAEIAHHRQHRRDANAPRHEYKTARTLVQREFIERRSNRDHVAFA